VLWERQFRRHSREWRVNLAILFHFVSKWRVCIGDTICPHFNLSEPNLEGASSPKMRGSKQNTGRILRSALADRTDTDQGCRAAVRNQRTFKLTFFAEAPVV
jgi:hypothetical protein